MSIASNLNRMGLTACRRSVQVAALLWLVYLMPWQLIGLLALTHLGTIARRIDADYRRTHDGYFGDGNG